MKDIFTIMNNATQKAFARVGKVTHQETDPDLRLYNELKPQDFTELMKDYGEDNVIEYIKAMEFKRLHRGRR
jgi:hypothetical protein